MQALVEIALQLSHSLIKDLPSNIGFFSLNKYFGESAYLLAHLKRGKLHRLNAETQSSFYLSNSPKNLLYDLLLLRGDFC